VLFLFFRVVVRGVSRGFWVVARVLGEFRARLFPGRSRVVGVGLFGGGAFLVVAWSNLLGLLPYVPSLFCLLQTTWRVVLWLVGAGVCCQVFYVLKSFSQNKVTGGLRLGLCFVVALLELVRVLIRFVTLAFRLVVNLSVGHLLLVVVGCLFGAFPTARGVLLVFLLVLEGVVRVVQRLIFSSLVLSYLSEDL
jgi:F0F1-type ATP synthase membrane subunit a